MHPPKDIPIKERHLHTGQSIIRTFPRPLQVPS